MAVKMLSSYNCITIMSQQGATVRALHVTTIQFHHYKVNTDILVDNISTNVNMDVFQ